jgi:hypothetical protein
VPAPPASVGYAPGRAVSFRINAGDTTASGENTFDDPVRLHSVEFVYTASQ